MALTEARGVGLAPASAARGRTSTSRMAPSESAFVIHGMRCAACASTIEQALARLGGVDAVEVVAATGRARVRWWPDRLTPPDLVAAIEAAGYAVRAAPSPAVGARRQRERRVALWRLFVAGFAMMQVMMYASPAYFAEPGSLPADLDALLRWASWLMTIPVLLFAAGPWLGGAWRDLRARRLGMDSAVALGIVVTFVASTGAMVAPGGVFGSEVYFDSLTMFVFFLLGGRWLELRARHATLGALDALVTRVPETVERLLDDGTMQRIAAQALRPGDRVRVLPGQAFPADGTLEPGCATQVDEAVLTGESLPVARTAGEAVLAGSWNRSSPVVMLVTRVGADTRYAGIVALMERAAQERPVLARVADRFARHFVRAVLLLALAGAIAWTFIDPTRSVWVAVSVLIVTCPCALSLATPSAVLAAAGTLARRGVLVQRLGALETLARADVFVFDKTGTLTEDRLALAGIDLAPRADRDAVMAHAAALAQSLHPVATALREACAAWTPAALHGVTEHAGEGVEGLDDRTRRWRLGSPAFAAPALATLALPPLPSESMTAVLSMNGALQARLRFDEVLRPGAREAVAELARANLPTWLLSGDRSGAAQRVARALAITRVQAGATPEDKLRRVTELQAGGACVAMVGDGINDAPVLARADVSIAMGQGAPIAQAQADFTLMSGRLGDLIAARRLARRMVAIVRQNLVWAALYNAACVPLALAGLLPPWAAGLGMAASSLFVVANAQRLRRLD